MSEYVYTRNNRHFLIKRLAGARWAVSEINASAKPIEFATLRLAVKHIKTIA